MGTRSLLIIGVIITFGFTIASAQGPHMMEPRVPADRLAEARALRNPLPASPDIIAPGKAIVMG